MAPYFTIPGSICTAKLSIHCTLLAKLFSSGSTLSVPSISTKRINLPHGNPSNVTRPLLGPLQSPSSEEGMLFPSCWLWWWHKSRAFLERSEHVSLSGCWGSISGSTTRETVNLDLNKEALVCQELFDKEQDLVSQWPYTTLFVIRNFGDFEWMVTVRVSLNHFH